VEIGIHPPKSKTSKLDELENLEDNRRSCSTRLKKQTRML
jgi:hypothetical protein